MRRNVGDLAIFIGKRLLQLIPVVVGVMAITFVLVHLAAQNPCAIWVPHARAAQLAHCIQYWGLNQPVYIQFVHYIGGLASGNWGVDPLGGQPVLPLIVQAVPATVELVLTATFLMVVIGIPLGAVAATASGRLADHVVRLFYLSTWSAPTYLVAIILAIGIGPLLGLPTTGEFTSTPTFPQPTHFSVLDALLAHNLPAAGDAVEHLILPAATLAFVNMGIATRMTRSSMLEILPLEFVRTARMKGLSEFFVVYKHALRNALITTVTVLGLTAGGLLSGTVVVEEIFQWPGIGDYAFAAITGFNVAGTIAVVIVFAVGVVLANLIADIFYGVLDPRVDWR